MLILVFNDIQSVWANTNVLIPNYSTNQALTQQRISANYVDKLTQHYGRAILNFTSHSNTSIFGLTAINTTTTSKNQFSNNTHQASNTVAQYKNNDIEISSIYIHNKKHTPQYIIEKSLKQNENYITIEYTAKNPLHDNKQYYQSRLLGIDTQWQNQGNKNSVTYTNLPPKNYTFEIRIANKNGQYSQTATLPFSVLKPLYKKIWFKILIMVLAIAFVSLGVIQIRKQQIKLQKEISERTRKLEIAYKELLNKNTKIREQNRQIERHHSDLEQKVAERTQALEIAKQKAEESDKLKSSFLANMSHEIRTPLNAISGFSALISSDFYSQERKEKYVNIIKSNISSLLKLVEDILDISKIEAGQLTIEKEFFNVNATISDIYETFSEEIKNLRGDALTLRCNNLPSPETIIFNSDQIRIRQIIGNLMSNAIKFTHKGSIELGYEIKEKSILFWIKDTGIGIKKSDIDSIFNRFIKIEERNTSHRGTGLGLSISKSLTKMLNGNIWVESTINKGSCFYVEIPGEIIIDNEQVLPKKEKFSGNLNLNNKLILVIEDEKSNFALIQSYLSTTNASIIWANDGKTGIDYSQKRTFDLILLDIRLPDISGYKVFEKLQSMSPNVPVIAQTAYATHEDRIKLSSFGFANFLIKPYTKIELLEKIADVLINKIKT